MGFSSPSESISSVVSSNTKVIALDLALQQSLEKFKDLVVDLEQLHIDSENYKLLYISARDKCKNKTCKGAEELKKIIESKDHIIQSVASTLTKLNETKNLSILTDAFNILFENAAPLTPPTENKTLEKNANTNTTSTKNISPPDTNSNPKNEVDMSITDDVSFKEESVCEIEGTPTGRVSPIIDVKKIRSTLAKPSDFRDKKKCPDDWPTSDSKALKLTPTPTRKKCGQGGKLRQSRLNLIKVKNSAVVDLTCSPEVQAQISNQLVQPLIKKESVDNDDTILPSPTSGSMFTLSYKNTYKVSPNKFKKSPLSLKNKCESFTKQDENKNTTNAEMEDSINILNHFANRVRNGMKKENEITVKKEKKTPVKKEKGASIEKEVGTTTPKKQEKQGPLKTEMLSDGDETYASISLMKQVDQVEEQLKKLQYSPSKRPLVENINIMNTPPKNDAESSMSILQPEPKTAAVENIRRRIPELVEPVYKEQAARNKAEKRNLQGWSCEECMNFYGELYKNDQVMLAKKINECSKHRGKHNPARPKTPPNFWNPRWHVPEDTEELNRMNNAT